MTVIAPFYQTEGIIEPYVSLNEVKFSPTAAAIDFTNLIENASIVAQDRALSELIKRASSKADIFCYGKMGTLNATVNTENGWYRPSRDGNITFTPVRSTLPSTRRTAGIAPLVTATSHSLPHSRPSSP